MIVLVTGGRNYDDRQCVFDNLDVVHAVCPITLLIEGGARGADRLCREWAIARGIPYETMNAEWDRHGRAAGLIRNGQMLDRCPRILVAFPGGRGTDNCCNQAAERRIPVYFSRQLRPT